MEKTSQYRRGMPRWCRIHFLLFAAQLDGLKITTSSNNNKMKNSPPNNSTKSRSFGCCFAWKNVIGRHFQKRRQRRIIGVRLIGFRVFVGWRNLSSQLHPPPNRNSPCWWATITRRTFLSAHVRVHYTLTHQTTRHTHTHTKRLLANQLLDQNFFFALLRPNREKWETSTTPDGWILRPVVLCCCHCVWCLCVFWPKASSSKSNDNQLFPPNWADWCCTPEEPTRNKLGVSFPLIRQPRTIVLNGA